MHISLLIVSFVIMQISQVKTTPKYHKITIRNVNPGTGLHMGKSLVSSSNTTQQQVTSVHKESQEHPTQKEVKHKVEHPSTQKAKSPPKKVQKDKVKSSQDKKTAKTLKKEVGTEETSRNSKNASLIEDALSSIAQEVAIANKKNDAVSQAIAILEGEGLSGNESMDYVTYIDIVGTKLKDKWFYPNLGRDEKLRATIRIFVDGTGKILSYRIERSSGREDFDAAAIRSIEQYTYFPPPPNRKAVDFVVNFNLLEE